MDVAVWRRPFEGAVGGQHVDMLGHRGDQRRVEIKGFAGEQGMDGPIAVVRHDSQSEARVALAVEIDQQVGIFRRPSSAARLTAVVVFPQPPLRLQIARTRSSQLSETGPKRRLRALASGPSFGMATILG